MEACLVERDFECRSANWRQATGECHLSEQDRHSVSQSEAGDQRVKASLGASYGPSRNGSLAAGSQQRQPAARPSRSGASASNYQNYYMAATGNLLERSRLGQQLAAGRAQRQLSGAQEREHVDWQLYMGPADQQHQHQQQAQVADVDYLENNCVQEPNKLCEFRKIQNKVLKTVDSIYQEVGSLEECKQKCLSAPYRCYSFDYGDTSERVCRTSHLDQASLLSVREPYLEVAGAITYELASCFNVTIQCRAKEMLATVSSSKSFRGKIYAKSRPSSCVSDVREALKFELRMAYNDPNCDVRSSSSEAQGVFSNDIVIQHHDRIVTTQDVGLSVYCHYDLGNRSVTNNVDLAIERIGEPVESKQQQHQQLLGQPGGGGHLAAATSPLTITGLATTVVRSPNVTMRITNMNGQPVSSATVGDRLALLFEIREKTSE